ncbi:response regulator [Aminobacter sp. AP02]|uniref:response regulator transcription factor n=1 Tax=Aminobacter sp. AP02 TaxID=2135737 RepID=UPI000D6BB645|nr:response regulator [Aminobacter sp. AP02]PWK65649.1 LuxR family two component transcriptional regulator [Aminobacter sp. AP02]
MAGPAPTVYLVDDDDRVLRALKRLLSSDGHSVACYSNAEEFLLHHDPEVPGCAVLDLGLPGMDGFGIQDALASGTAQRPLIFLTGRGDIPASVRAMKAGAVDFLTKPVERSALLAAVAQALVRDKEMRQNGEQRSSLEQRLSKLTPREREVLTLVVAGRLNKQIAGELGTVEKTIKVHRGRMMNKMGVRTVADLVRLVARQQG